MAAPSALSEHDVEVARAELSAGKPVTVWFTAAAVGVAARASARVISIGEPAEGDFIQVKPAGSRDTMFCSASELTRARPPRGRAEKPGRPAAGPAPVDSAPVEPAAVEPAPASGALPAPSATAPDPVPPVVPARRVAAGRPPPARQPARTAEVTVTLNATPEGEWTVEVAVGKRRTVRPTPVQPAEVAKAARSLPPAVGEAIESSLTAARARQVERVERLSAELEAAQRALDELSS